MTAASQKVSLTFSSSNPRLVLESGTVSRFFVRRVRPRSHSFSQLAVPSPDRTAIFPHPNSPRIACVSEGKTNEERTYHRGSNASRNRRYAGSGQHHRI